MADTVPTISGTEPGEERDPSQFIRTFAKDVAQATGAQAASVSKFQTTAKTLETTDNVTLPEFDSSPVNHPDGASPKEFASEIVDLPSMQEAGNIVGKGSGSVSSTPPSTQYSSMPSSPIVPLPTVTPSAPSAASENRNAILARLRERVANHSVPQTPLAPTTFSSSEPLASVTTTPTIPAPTPVRATPSVADASFRESAPLHTFSSDFADHIDTRGASQFSVLAAQSDDISNTNKPTKAKITSKKNFTPVFVATAVLIILIAGGSAAGAYLYTHQRNVTPATASIPSLIVADEQVMLSGSGTTLEDALVKTSGQSLVANSVLMTYLAPSTDDSTAGRATGDFFAALAPAFATIPDILTRNVDPASTIGVVHATPSDGSSDETAPFFILRVSSYERTFAGMLAWEPTLDEDMTRLYPAYPQAASLPEQAAPAISASTTATTSKTVAVTPAPVVTASAFTYQFVDAVVANHDVRILRDASGRSLMLYGYRDKQTLIIARNEAAFSLLLDRLNATNAQ